MPRRPRTIDPAGDAQRSAGAGDSVPQHFQPVSPARRSGRALRVRAVPDGARAQCPHLRIELSIATPGPAGTTLQPKDIVRRTSSDPGRALLTGFVGGPAPRDDWEKFDVPGLRGISKTAPYFINNSAATLEEMVDHYIALFTRAEVNFVPGPGRRAPDRDDRRRELRSTADARGARRAACVSEEVVGLTWTLLRRQVDQDDVGVLARAVEDEVLAVRRDVERIQEAAIAEVGELPGRVSGEIEQPEVLGFNVAQVDKAQAARQETVGSAHTDPDLRHGYWCAVRSDADAARSCRRRRRSRWHR